MILRLPNDSKSNVKVYKLPTLTENFGLTKEEFIKFTDNVRCGDETLFLIIFKKHFDSSVTYLSNKFNINKENAHDICMDTMLEFREKLVKGKIQYGNLRYLFTRMAVNNFIDHSTKEKKIKTAIDLFLEDMRSENITNEEFFRTLETVIDLLDKKNKKLLNDLYYSDKAYHDIAEEHQISYPALRKRKQRLLNSIQKSFFSFVKNK